MLAEAVIAGIAYALGWSFIRLAGATPGIAFAVAAAYPFGVSVWVLVAAGLLVTGLPFHPLGVTVLAVVLLGTLSWRWGPPLHLREFASAAAGGTAVAATAAALTYVEWTFLTSDSLMILGAADQIMAHHGLTPSLRASLASFPLFLSLAHTPAVWLDLTYLKSLPPLFGLACVAAVGLLTRRALSVPGIAPSPVTRLLPITAAVVLASTPLFLWGATYVNGHIIFAWVMLLACGGLYLAALERSPAWWFLAVAAAACLVSLRMEAGLTALPILIAAAAVPVVPLAVRLVTLGGVAIAFGGWYAFLIIKSFAHGLIGVYEMLVIGAAPGLFGGLLLAAAALHRRLGAQRVEGFLAALPWAMIATLLAVIAAHGIVSPASVVRAVRGFAGFIADARFGAEGFGLVVALLLLLGPLAAPRHRPARLVSWAVLGYLLVVFVIGVRTPWQNPDISDSTNRMLIHALPSLLFYALVRYAKPGRKAETETRDEAIPRAAR